MPPKTLRILCLGASLVAGYSCYGAVHHPFSTNMVKMIRIIEPTVDIEAIVDGVPGDKVTTGRFAQRMQSHFAEGQEKFDWTIVLGGTNDIAFFESANIDQIMEKFKTIWNIPLAHGSKVLALTIPSATIDSEYSRLVELRNALNQRIKDHKADGFHVFDLHDALPCDSAHIKYWDDAIHFTPDGYDVIGDRVGAALMGIIVAERAKGPS